jgi:hypothetical protein
MVYIQRLWREMRAARAGNAGGAVLHFARHALKKIRAGSLPLAALAGSGGASRIRTADLWIMIPSL